MKISELELLDWLRAIKNENTRPKYISVIDDTNFEKPFGMVATVYKYTNLKNHEKIYKINLCYFI